MNYINNELEQKTFISIFLNISYAFIEFFLTLTLPRFLGTFEFGKYVFFISLIRFLGLPVIVGYPYFILRKSSYINSQTKKEYNLLLNKNIYILAIYLILLLVSILLFKFLNYDFLKDNFKFFLLCIVSIIPLVSINNSIAAIIRSSGAEIKGQILENLIPNTIFLIFIFLLNLIYKFETFNIYLFLFIGSTFLSLIYSLYKTKNIISWSKIKIYNLKNQIYNEIKESSIFILIQIFVLANNLLPIIILGFFQEPQIVGNYKLAIQLASISGLCLHAINKIVQPRFAKSYSLSDYNQIQKIALSSNLFVSICSFAVSIFVFLFYKEFIILFFGFDFFIPRLTFLLILISPLINSIFGSAAEILIMCGNEKVTLLWASICLFIGIILNFILAPFWGINGVAISILITTYIRGFILWKKSFLLLNINSSFILDKIFKLKKSH